MCFFGFNGERVVFSGYFASIVAKNGFGACDLVEASFCGHGVCVPQGERGRACSCEAGWVGSHCSVPTGSNVSKGLHISMTNDLGESQPRSLGGPFTRSLSREGT